MSEKEVIITYYMHAEKWRFDLVFGKYKLGGMGNSLTEVEDKANFALTGFPKHDVVHVKYTPGRSVVPAKGNISDSFIKEVMQDNEEILDKLGSDYDDQGIPYWEKWPVPLTDEEQE